MNTMLTLEGQQKLATLLAPVRNRYFYGKLLDADHLELEQRYFLDRGRMINRLTLGAGVLCGLHVVPRGAQAVVSPGVAIDGLGREIVVTESVTVDPWSLERENGTTEAPKSLVLLLCYHECDAEPAPVLVADCELREECVPSVVRERFALRVIDADKWRPSGQLSERECQAIFGEGPSREGPVIGSHEGAIEHIGLALRRLGTDYAALPHSDLRERLCEILSPNCTASPDCVPIALITRDGENAISVDECAPRTTVYSNSMLLELILCLAERVEECCGHRVRTQAPVITELYPAPAVVVPRSEYIGQLDGAAFSLTFDHELMQQRLEKPNDWMRVLVMPSLPPDTTAPADTTDDTTAPADTGAPAAPPAAPAAPPAAPSVAQPVRNVSNVGSAANFRNVGLILPVELVGTESATGTAVRATYKYTADGTTVLTALLERLKPPSLRVALIIRSDDLTQIADTSDPPELLDADFAGTALPALLTRELLWAIDVTQPIPVPITAATVPTLELPQGTPMPSLPSGNGIEGGLFHAWFGIDLNA